MGLYLNGHLKQIIMIKFTSLFCVCVMLFQTRITFGLNCTIENHFNEFDVWNCAESFRSKIGSPEAGLACYPVERPSRQSDTIRFSNSSRWSDMCGMWSETAECIRKKFSSCTVEGAMTLLEDRKVFLDTNMDVEINGLTIAPIYHFGKRVCLNGLIRPEIYELKESDVSCLSREDAELFMNCYETLDCEIRRLGYGELNDNPGIIKILERFSSGSLRCLRDIIDNSPCGQTTKRYLWLLALLQMPSAVHVEHLHVNEKAIVNFGSEQRCTVGAYGDPHLLYCNTDKLVTCHATGERVFLSNPFMEIRAINEEIDLRLRQNPTVIRQVSIKFKSADGYEDVTTYIAKNASLPETFVNGKTTAGEGYDEVIITADTQQVTFFQRAMGIILSLRARGPNYFFTMRMSTSIAMESHGLLATGCPLTDIIKRDGLLLSINEDVRRRRGAIDLQCSNGCDQIGDDQMTEICNFDCGITRDIGFVSMAEDAMTDLLVVKTHDKELRLSADAYELSKHTTAGPTTGSSTKEITTSSSPSLVPMTVLFLITHVTATI